MTTAPATPPDGPTGLTKRLADADRRRLATLERAKSPTPMQRGELAALRIRATEPDDVSRTRALAERWSRR